MAQYAQPLTDAAEQKLWRDILAHEGEPFATAKGLPFSPTIRGAEIFIDRKEKPITRVTILHAYRRTKELGGVVSGPKMLGVFGASYLYPIFQRLGVIAGDNDEENIRVN